jgi:hypothetical protein
MLLEQKCKQCTLLSSTSGTVYVSGGAETYRVRQTIDEEYWGDLGLYVSESDILRGLTRQYEIYATHTNLQGFYGIMSMGRYQHNDA